MGIFCTEAYTKRGPEAIASALPSSRSPPGGPLRYSPAVKNNVHETERLVLEPFGEKHLTPRYVRWLNDPEVTRWSEQRHVTHTLESCRAYYESFVGTPNMFFAIVHKGELGHVGNLNVYVEPRHGLADIGILVGERSAWGNGYGYEAWTCILHALLKEPSIRKVTGGSAANNVAMQKIMRAAGMVEDGRRARHYVYDGSEVDIVYFAAFKSE